MTTVPPTLAPAPRVLLWVAHLSVWLLAGLAARLSRTGSQLEVHITGRNGAELAPDHLRQILTAPTTEFKAISLIGVIAAFVLSLALSKHGPRSLRGLTIAIAAVCLVIYFAGYGFG